MPFVSLLFNDGNKILISSFSYISQKFFPKTLVPIPLWQVNYKHSTFKPTVRIVMNGRFSYHNFTYFRVSDVGQILDQITIFVWKNSTEYYIEKQSGEKHG